MGQEGGTKGDAPVPNLGKEATWGDGVNQLGKAGDRY